MKKVFRENGLSLVFIFLFLSSLSAQLIAGFKVYNEERLEEHLKPIDLGKYLHSGHFIQATFENWESEFLQMALFVWLTIFLRQKGSSESKSLDGQEEVDREPNPARKAAPWPVKKGGLISKFYKHSLTLTLLILYLLSALLHFYGSFRDENEKMMQRGLPFKKITEYLSEARFWFESFQNWQSEFLSVFAIIFLSIYLRQQGSPQSKPVDAPSAETGE